MTITRRNSARPGFGPAGVEATPPLGVRADGEPLSGVYALKPGEIWRFLKRQPASYWLVLIYLFFEYVRPQSIYAAIEGPPYARIAIILAFVAFLFEQRRIRLGTPEIFLALFSLVVVASSVTAFMPSVSYEGFSLYFSWVLIYLLIANAVDTEGRFLVFVLTFLLYSFKMSQFGTRSWAQNGFAFVDWGVTGAPGWFANSGEFGLQMCVFLPLTVAFTMGLKDHWPKWQQWVAWGVAATAVVGMIASSSRGALVGCAAVVLWLVLKSRRKTRAVLTTLVVAALVYVLIPPEQKERFHQSGADTTSVSRTTAWKEGIDIMNDNPVLGIGYDNWDTYHRVTYGYKMLSHNIFVQAGSELGYTGLLAFVALIVLTLALNRRTRKIALGRPDRGKFIFFMAHGLDAALIGFLASGFFVTVLYYPYFWINLAMTVALNNAAVSSLGQQVPSQPPTSGRAGAVRPRGVVRVVS
jgi:putative inorganic carbon (hco3(-)) transporter